MTAPGHASSRRLLDIEAWSTARPRFDLEMLGPETADGAFFAGRVAAGDHRYLAELVGRLGTDLVVVTGIRKGEDLLWLVDSSGRVIAREVLGQEGAMLALLAPYRVRLDAALPDAAAAANYALPMPAEGGPVSGPQGISTAGWLLILGGAVLLAVAAGGDEGSGGGSEISVSW